jgi:hypoxanthine phosphoribosyltransferase
MDPMGMSRPVPRSSGFDQYLDLSWEMFGELCRALALRVAREFDPELVVGIARAGVIPGAVIASVLRLDFYSMMITRREGDEVVRQRPEVLSAAPPQARGRRVLLVDEITSSGDTLRLGIAACRDVAPAELRTATCFVRPGGYKPDYFALETDQTIIFPWDRKIFEGDNLVVNPRYEEVIDE